MALAARPLLGGLAGEALARAPRASAPRLYVETLNEMIDAETLRVAALTNRVPTAVLVLEVLGSAIALGLLAALAPTLNDVSRTLGYAVRYQVTENAVQLSSGRGVWCAFAGVAAIMLALYLAGRHESAVVAETAAVDGERVTEAPAAVWSWRRPSPTDEEDRSPAAPFDLEVTSTTPFTTLNGDRDKPTGRDGISG